MTCSVCRSGLTLRPLESTHTESTFWPSWRSTTWRMVLTWVRSAHRLTASCKLFLFWWGRVYTRIKGDVWDHCKPFLTCAEWPILVLVSLFSYLPRPFLTTAKTWPLIFCSYVYVMKEYLIWSQFESWRLPPININCYYTFLTHFHNAHITR